MQQRPWRPCTVDYAGIQGHVYTLLLESGNYYVGWSSTVEYRIAQHFCSASSKWTMQHNPLQVLACVAGDTRLEAIVTISLMSKFGWERVRGGRWCQLALEGPPDAVMRAMAPQKPRPDPCNGHAAPDGSGRRACTSPAWRARGAGRARDDRDHGAPKPMATLAPGAPRFGARRRRKNAPSAASNAFTWLRYHADLTAGMCEWRQAPVLAP